MGHLPRFAGVLFPFCLEPNWCRLDMPPHWLLSSYKGMHKARGIATATSKVQMKTHLLLLNLILRGKPLDFCKIGVARSNLDFMPHTHWQRQLFFSVIFLEMWFADWNYFLRFHLYNSKISDLPKKLVAGQVLNDLCVGPEEGIWLNEKIWNWIHSVNITEQL